MRSLASRLLLVIAAWLSIALLVTGILLSTLFRNNAENNFQGLLLAHAYNLMGAIELSEDGKITGTPNLGDPRFLQPLSGWYWMVSAAKNPEVVMLNSRSISGKNIAVPTVGDNPFNEKFRRTYDVTDEPELQVQRLEAQLFLGESDVLFQVMVAGNRNDLEQAISDFNRTILMFFGIFGVGTIIATFFAIRFGLKPLEQTTSSLNNIREGRAEMLEGEFPAEIEPLADEINALIAANKSVTERARAQVGNLAHALKTPLAVIANEVRKPNSKTVDLVGEQAGLMQSQISTYLSRARIAAQQGVISVRTLVDPVSTKFIRIMEKLNPNIKFEYSNESPSLVFQGEQQDLEEVLGNLLENASRFAKSKVSLQISELQGNHSSKFEIAIEDDGPGISSKHRVSATKRGRRLDESKPGSGLGLSIVHDIADEYGGRLELEKSSMGGLRVVVFLPKTNAT